jgi:Uma2 family endonuclease
MSDVAATTQKMTAEEFCDWVHRPENDNKWFELVRGEVIELPPPFKRHGAVCVRVSTLLSLFVEAQPRGYVTGNDSGVILERDPDTVRGPDVAVYDDAQEFSDLHPKYGEVPPRLAVEVLSPSDKWTNVMRKVTDYLRSGVGLVWVIDPEARTVTACKSGLAPVLLEENQEVTGDEALPGFRCRVGDFFALRRGQ